MCAHEFHSTGFQPGKCTGWGSEWVVQPLKKKKNFLTAVHADLLLLNLFFKYFFFLSFFVVVHRSSSSVLSLFVCVSAGQTLTNAQFVM